jgi:hypothetical protein
MLIRECVIPDDCGHKHDRMELEAVLLLERASACAEAETRLSGQELRTTPTDFRCAVALSVLAQSHSSSSGSTIKVYMREG